MTEVFYKLKLVKNNIEIEVCGDKDFVEKKFKELTNDYLNKSINNDLDHKNNELKTNKKELSLIDFVNQKCPKSTATGLMPVLVYYAKHFEGIEKFNEVDIKNLYRRYDISKRPKKIYQAILDINRNKGYFESVPKDKGYFRLTEAGEHFVEVKLTKLD
ncbi:hypothetical protein A3D00_01470 [Candidatus Woesebacteria bacterium RIFCSPHIGHO2_02_FULL_38_9]|uniref:Uncharacterized protein n=1 Tax=Candidatus Roizmanbacteria bacterium RIFCSPLOWO2_01_FULL_41_22 TaxID=1802067 RepID=A0A1F7JAM9_9BACT|nr:MAG: hypothetical protein A2966_02220 [Candidatus Roizmanbacteria bacterium RIFCSPLOWO2_01_FULL_41_22]OGM32112.1 MAG: hypothetical protein A3D00_01470 [Candidatus Woesebacteria bacterium RIFCSPHIGHO2_02_FULL_38_9]